MDVFDDIYQEVSNLDALYKDSRVPINIPSWDNWFMMMAFLASRRSPDAQTQHGCVIVDSRRHVIGVGYNGFPPGMPDDLLPNLRPAKYDWMTHSEHNAVDNCTVKPIDAKAYITGHPCFRCAEHMYRNGIREFIWAADRWEIKDPAEKQRFSDLVLFGKVSCRTIKFPEPSFTFPV